MSTKRIILISGYARSGKDTLANALLAEFAKANKEAALTKFANALKSALQLALNDVGLGHINVFTEDTAEKEILRPLLVEFGKYCRAKDKDVFVNRTLKDVDAMLQLGKDVVLISDCRYLNEAQLVRSFGILNCLTVERFHIKRMGNVAANQEEADSIDNLEAYDTPTFSSRNIFSEGNVDAIGGWARRIVAVRAFKESGGIAGNHEPRIHGMDAPDLHALRYGVTATVPEHLTGSIVVPDNELLEQVLNIKLALERIDARLKRLEVDRG